MDADVFIRVILVKGTAIRTYSSGDAHGPVTDIPAGPGKDCLFQREQAEDHILRLVRIILY